MTITRRQLLKQGAVGAAVLAGPAGALLGPGGLLASPAGGARIARVDLWTDALPVPGPTWPVIDATTTRVGTHASAAVTAEELSVQIHRDLPATRVWGYTGGRFAAARSTYLGPTVVAARGVPVDLHVSNHLPATPLFPADPALLPPHTPECRLNTHLHGGRVGDTEDGNPFDAYGDRVGGQPEIRPQESQTQTYANEQGPALLWYHDHALGITRTNVYAGLAGAYLLTDPDPVSGVALGVGNVPEITNPEHVSDLPDPNDPAGGKIPLHIPLVVQDKTLDADGQLVYPEKWTPEFFGTTCLVNGKAFPYLDVQPRKYRFTFLNGSQSRFYSFRFNKPVTITQVGVELGPIDAPQRITTILLGPAERADVVIDFSGLRPGTKVVMVDTVLPVGVVSPTRPLGDCMQFRVSATPVSAGSPTFPGAPVLPGWSETGPTPRPGAGPWPRSKVTLEEVMGRGGKPIMAVVNGAPFMRRAGGIPGQPASGTMTHEPDAPFTTEIVANGSTVEWLYLNLTADSHPFHTHLAHFEVVDRTPFDAAGYMMALGAARAARPPGERLDPKDYPVPVTLGPPVPAPPQERGPKDTVIANPGEITRIRLRVELPTAGARAGRTELRYVYHCHILEHEENEMMRPLLVTLA